MAAPAALATSQGVLAAAPTTGLVASAITPSDSGDHWESGFAWIPERCGADYQLLAWCTTDDPDAYTEPRTGGAYYRPVGARFAVECTTLGGAVDSERLRRVAEATVPFVIARELWEGVKGQDDSWTAQGATYSNAYLASSDATEVGASATTILPALARLEHAAMEAARGQQVMLHLPILATAGLAEYVRRVGQRLLTRQDNIVVVDAGYTGTGPNDEAVGSTAWAYATPPVMVRRSPLQLVDTPLMTVDRATNTVTAWAELVFAATFDPCVHLATEITL